MLNFDDYAVLTFDCYGTLIDWESGISEALAPVFAAHDVTIDRESALELFGVLESEVERGEYVDYKTVLGRVLAGMGARLGFTPDKAALAAVQTEVAGLGRVSIKRITSEMLLRFVHALLADRDRGGTHACDRIPLLRSSHRFRLDIHCFRAIDSDLGLGCRRRRQSLQPHRALQDLRGRHLQDRGGR